MKFVVKFWMDNKHLKDGFLKSLMDTRKYKDAIMWGAGIAGQKLHTSFYDATEKYLKSYKKLAVKARKDGNIHERAADPISFSLYVVILKWAIESDNTLVWFWTLAQWNCMAWCASIDPLGFHNFTLGQDSIIVKYDDSKADKDGERLSEKNIYANNENYYLCFWTSLGIWCALNNANLCLHEKLFLGKKSKEGSAASRYQEQLLGIVLYNKEEVANHIRIDHMNAYGLQKGSATLAVSGTTVPPPVTSIARRGEWSMGKVLHVY